MQAEAAHVRFGQGPEGPSGSVSAGRGTRASRPPDRRTRPTRLAGQAAHRSPTGNIGRELTREFDAVGVPFRVFVRDPARASGIPATFLRPGGFTANKLGWAPAIRAGGHHGVPHRHRAAAARAGTPDLRGLVYVQRRRVPRARPHLTRPGPPPRQRDTGCVTDVTGMRIAVETLVSAR
ncbi:MAG: hypothetical protein ACRDN0_39335 [Trebonia sp.]